LAWRGRATRRPFDADLARETVVDLVGENVASGDRHGR
jgi:hypothetical protein